MFEEAIGIERNLELAVKLYHIAVDQNHPVALCSLAILYDTGRGVPQDKVKAVALFEKSAAQDNPASQNNLGRYVLLL